MIAPDPAVDRPDPVRHGACVMIAEDDAELNSLLAEALQEAGCEVVQAFDGMHAYELLRQRRPDLILMDLDLPRLYGHVVMRTLPRDPATAHIRVIVLTAQPELLQNEDRALAAAVLHKPVDLDQLIAAVRRVAEQAPGLSLPLPARADMPIPSSEPTGRTGQRASANWDAR